MPCLGITRKPAEPASGHVTFGRNTPPSEITKSGETHLYDQKKYYGLKSIPVKDISRVKGNLNGKSHTFVKGADYVLKDDLVMWLVDGKKPDKNTVFYVDYIGYEEIKIPEGTKVSTYSREPKNVRVFETTKDEILKMSEEGKWEVDIPAKALVSGKAGNVYAGTITVMPQPPKGTHGHPRSQRTHDNPRQTPIQCRMGHEFFSGLSSQTPFIGQEFGD